MITRNWQLESPVTAIVFDCDGTLSTIEGIDVLADHNGAGGVVSELTAEAMGKTGINPSLYQKRLELVSPSYEQVLHLGDEYYANRIDYADEIIRIFKRLNKSIYIISAGISLAVKHFGTRLQVPEKNIFAVDVNFDAHGQYQSFDNKSPLTDVNGKRNIITEIKKSHPHILSVGDGLNDVETMDLVTRFIGFGGMYYRENIANLCEFYITYPSLSPLLPLALTEAECELLEPDEMKLYMKGMKHIMSHDVLLTSSPP